MEKQLYESLKGGGYRLLISSKEYRQVMYDIKNENVYMNPFIHLIKGDYTFIHNDKTISVSIDIKNGVGKIFVKDGDISLMSYRRIKSLYKLYNVQIEYWNIFGIPMVHHLMGLELLNDENLDSYRSVIFYPPILFGRTEWDVMEVREDYYIHRVDGDNEWCLYHWVSGQKEVCMDLYVTGDDIDMVKDKFCTILDEMGVKPTDKTMKWSDVTYNDDGTFTLTKCG